MIDLTVGIALSGWMLTSSFVEPLTSVSRSGETIFIVADSCRPLTAMVSAQAIAPATTRSFLTVSSLVQPSSNREDRDFLTPANHPAVPVAHRSSAGQGTA